MKKALKILAVFILALLMNCGGKEEKKSEGFTYENNTSTEQKVETKAVKIKYITFKTSIILPS